jgi:hypothetical protein
MMDEDTKPQAEPMASDSEASEEGSLNDMLQELRILLQGAQREKGTLPIFNIALTLYNF